MLLINICFIFIIIVVDVISMSLGEKIRELRKKNGLSQEQLAKTLNVSRQAVQKWEKDINEPSIDTIKFIASYFQVDYEFLLNGEGSDSLSKNTISSIKHNKFNDILYYILLAFSFLVIILCFVWSLIDKRSSPTFGEGFYNWYIPFYSSDIELIVFQVLNIAAIVGIVFCLIKIIKNRKKNNL